MEEILERIKYFADQAHGDQRRKYTPDRYIVHPIRVMEICRKYTNDITILAAALLHDVLEDTSVQKEEMKDFLLTVLNPQQTSRTIRMVEELTDVYVKMDFPGLNRKSRKAKELERLKSTSADSQTIKYADILDNSIEIATQDTDFALVYVTESQKILQNLTSGNAVLHADAVEVIDEVIRKLK